MSGHHLPLSGGQGGARHGVAMRVSEAQEIACPLLLI